MLVVNLGQIEVGVVVVGFENDSLLVVGDGLVFLVDRVEELAQKIESFGVGGSQVGNAKKRIDALKEVLGVNRRQVIKDLGSFFPEAGIGRRESDGNIGVVNGLI